VRTRRCTDAQNYTTEKKVRRRGREGDEDEGRGDGAEGRGGEGEKGDEGRGERGGAGEEEKAGDPAVEWRADT